MDEIRDLTCSPIVNWISNWNFVEKFIPSLMSANNVDAEVVVHGAIISNLFELATWYYGGTGDRRSKCIVKLIFVHQK